LPFEPFAIWLAVYPNPIYVSFASGIKFCPMNAEDRRHLISAFVMGMVALILWVVLQFFT